MGEPSASVPNGAQLLGRIVEFVRRFIVLPEGVAPLLGAWVVHTHAFAAADYTPYIVVRSATKGCGKSRLLEVMELVVANPLASANITPAALYRVIVEGQEPTMLLDEQDGIRDEETRRVLNAGFRRGQRVMRTSKDQQGVDEFPAFCPKVIASIGAVSPTVADRSIHVKMTRKLPSESVERFQRRDVEPNALAIRDEARAFAEHHFPDLVDARPAFPAYLDDRGRDIFAPLFAIADIAGAPWSVELRDAAVANRRTRFGQRDDPQTELLRDVRSIVSHLGAEGFVFSNALVLNLTRDESLRWAEWNRGRGLTQKGLATMLAEFGVTPSVKQINGEQRRGYFVKDFQETFLRYLGVSEEQEQTVSAPATENDDAAGSVLAPPGPKSFFKTRAQREEERKLTG